MQVFGVARQVLSLVAGSAIDEYVLSQLRLLRQQHTLARILHGLQNTLWPGGVWFQDAPDYPKPASAQVSVCQVVRCCDSLNSFVAGLHATGS